MLTLSNILPVKESFTNYIKIYHNIKLQQENNREVAKISASFSEKIDKYEHTAHQEISPPNHRQKGKHPKFTYYPSAKAFKKQTND